MSDLPEEIEFCVKFKWEFCRRDPELLTRWATLERLRTNKDKENCSDKKSIYSPETDEEWELFSNCDFPSFNPSISYDDIGKFKNKISRTKIKRMFIHFLINKIYLYRNLKEFDFDHTKNPLTLLMSVDFSRQVDPNALKKEFNDLVDAYMLARDFVRNSVVGNLDGGQEVSTAEVNTKSSLNVKKYINTIYNTNEDYRFAWIIRNVAKHRDNIIPVSGCIDTSDMEKILLAGDMYYMFDGKKYVKRGVTQLSVARKLFPDDFKTTYEGNPPSKTTRVSQLCKLYLKLACGGWRDLLPSAKRKKSENIPLIAE
jgi:hypothetical protein